MRPTWKRLAVTSAFTVLCGVQISFLSGARDVSSLVWLLLLAAAISYVAWPAVSKAAVKRGSTFEPSWLRLAWSIAIAVVTAIPFFLGVRLLQHGDVHLSQVLAALTYFGVMAYLAWPGARREMARRRGR